MNLEETKEKLDWCKRVFECKQKSSYRIENKNDITRIHNNEVNKLADCNLLYDMINPPKRAKNLNTRYSPILNGWMNTREKVKQSLKTFALNWTVDVVPLF